MDKNLMGYQIHKECNLIMSWYCGSLTISNIKNLMLRLSKELYFSKNYDIVHDFRNCNLEIDGDELPEYIDFLDKELNIIAKRRVAFLTNKPNQVVLATLFNVLLIETPLVTRVFSTPEAVFQFLNNDKIDRLTFNQMLIEKNFPVNART